MDMSNLLTVVLQQEFGFVNRELSGMQLYQSLLKVFVFIYTINDLLLGADLLDLFAFRYNQC